MNDNALPWPLLARYLADEVSPDERRTVDDWIAATDANQRMFDQIRHRWLHSVLLNKTAPSSDSAAVWDRYVAPHLPTGQEIPVRPLAVFRQRLGWLTWPMAAATAGLLLYAGYRQFIPELTAPQVAATTTVGSRAMLTLPDGSRVWLNADSKLEYPKTFAGPLREVRLTGEAFFDVTHNPKQPFVIRLATASIRVLGTSFNVRAYPGDGTVKTTVVTGRVAFIANKPVSGQRAAAADTLFILPNHHVTQAVQTGAVAEEPVVAANETAWKDNRLVFEQTPLREVAQTLERWYGLPVYLEGGIDNCPLTATFSGQSLGDVLDLISRTGRFTSKLTTEKATLSGRPCH